MRVYFLEELEDLNPPYITETYIILNNNTKTTYEISGRRLKDGTFYCSDISKFSNDGVISAINSDLDQEYAQQLIKEVSDIVGRLYKLAI